MSIPSKNHYLPKFYMNRWTDQEGLLTEYRRPVGNLTSKRKYPAQTGYITDLYANTNKSDPVERQALEILFLQKVDGAAAEAMLHLEKISTKPTDPFLRDAWARFLMSLMHRSPVRVKYLAAKVRDYESALLNPDLREKYVLLRGENDPVELEEWLATAPPLTSDLITRLLKMLIDNRRIGETLNEMHWCVRTLILPQFGFLSGDQPLIMSDGIGRLSGFVGLAISPTQLFIAAHERKVIDAFRTQKGAILEKAINDACARQSHHVIIARDDTQRVFVDRRFLKRSAPVGPSGFVSWKPPPIEV